MTTGRRRQNKTWIKLLTGSDRIIGKSRNCDFFFFCVQNSPINYHCSVFIGPHIWSHLVWDMTQLLTGYAYTSLHVRLAKRKVQEVEKTDHYLLGHKQGKRCIKLTKARVTPSHLQDLVAEVSALTLRHMLNAKAWNKSQKNAMPVVKHGGGFVMLWSCFASSGTGMLQHVEDKMDSSITVGKYPALPTVISVTALSTEEAKSFFRLQ